MPGYRQVSHCESRGLAPEISDEILMREWCDVFYCVWRTGDKWGAGAEFRSLRWVSDAVALNEDSADRLATSIASAFISWLSRSAPSEPRSSPRLDAIPELGYSESHPSRIMDLDEERDGDGNEAPTGQAKVKLYPVCACDQPLVVDGECKLCHTAMEQPSQETIAAWASWDEAMGISGTGAE